MTKSKEVQLLARISALEAKVAALTDETIEVKRGEWVESSWTPEPTPRNPFPAPIIGRSWHAPMDGAVPYGA